MAVRKEKLEVIVWRDAWFGYSLPEEREDITEGKYLLSCGFLVRETKDEVILATETSMGKGDMRVRHVGGILKKNIVSRTTRPIHVKEM